MVEFKTEMEILSSKRNYFRNNLQTVPNGMEELKRKEKEIPALLKDKILDILIENSEDTNKENWREKK